MSNLLMIMILWAFVLQVFLKRLCEQVVARSIAGCPEIEVGCGCRIGKGKILERGVEIIYGEDTPTPPLALRGTSGTPALRRQPGSNTGQLPSTASDSSEI